jgi:hypothetical protein
VGATLTLVGVALAGCSAAPPASIPAGLAVSVVQQRGDVAPGRVQVRVDNASGAPLTVVSATILSSALSRPAVWDSRRTQTVDPGRVVNLPVLLPPLLCAVGDDDVRVQLDLAVGARTDHVEVDADDPLGVLARLSATQCDRDAIAAVARVEAGAVSPRDDATADLSVVITPRTDAGRSGSRLELVALTGTPLLRFAGGEEAALSTIVTPGDPPSTLTAVVTPRRCDPHAIAEDKVGTLFDLVARVDGREVVVPLERSRSTAEDLLAFTAAACGLAR